MASASGVGSIPETAQCRLCDPDFHCAAPRFENSVTACDGMRLLPGRSSTVGSRPSRSNLQIDVRLTFNARAACAIVSNRRSVGSVRPSPMKTASIFFSSLGVAVSRRPINCSLFMLSLSVCRRALCAATCCFLTQNRCIRNRFFFRRAPVRGYVLLLAQNRCIRNPRMAS